MNQANRGLIKNYKLFTLATDAARTNKPINFGGNSILIISSPVNIDIRIHSIDNEVVTIKQLGSVIEKEGFSSFFITHAALAGGTIKFLVYADKNLFIDLGAAAASGGGSATTIGEDSLALTLANTEYSKAITDNTKRLKLINNSVDAVLYVSFTSGNSANGIPIPPLSSENIEAIDLEGSSMYVQSDIASRTLNYMEFL
jgi:hypothetical protein